MDKFKVFLLVALTFAAIFSAIYLLVWGLTAWSCSSHQRITGTPTQMSIGACYVQEGGKWMSWDEYKLRFATKGAE